VIYTVTLNPGPDRTLTVPHFRYDEVLRATSLRVDWGGKGLNVSRALKALGTDSIATGFAGGHIGRMVAAGLAAIGIETDFVQIAGETRTNTVFIEEATGRYIKVNEAGPTISDSELARFLARASRLVAPDDIWIIGGKPPPGVPPDTYARLISLIHRAGARALLDTSGEPLRLGSASAPYLVKPNLSEATEVAATETTPLTGPKPPMSEQVTLLSARLGVRDEVTYFFRRGVELVALSMGANGLLLASRSQAVWARPPRVPVRNPVGAGDALMAGVAWSISREAPLEAMARWGVAAGTASAIRDRVGFDRREEVEALLPQVQLNRGPGAHESRPTAWQQG
jgi:1-phosphofructokinase family hexose kinase